MAEFKEIIRVGNADLDGNKKLMYALTKIKGVKYMFANAICEALGLDKNMKAGNLTDEQIEKIEDAIRHPEKYNIPSWLYNRRKDPETGKDVHLISNDLDFAIQQDINLLKKTKAYRGIRHALGLPVRGQRTKSNFRKSKVVRNRKIKSR